MGDNTELFNFDHRLVDLFSTKTFDFVPESYHHTKAALLRYAALLHHTNMGHSHLNAVLASSRTVSEITSRDAAREFSAQLAKMFLHPRLALFLPVLPLYLPAYITGALAARFISQSRLAETVAEYKAIFGGLALATTYAGVGSLLARWVCVLGRTNPATFGNALFIYGIRRLGRRICGAEGAFGRIRGTVGMVGLVMGALWLVTGYHNMLVKSKCYLLSPEY
jgi:hypothetical protein